ncbi:GNAT family N-acetyltransferase [Streptomyces alkaliterrae]|uniref:GNAT family N-acetyltransferase n=1 Tax=Streptomyces alkaliterrae TaxID=2213162 RepID=A0A5P0YTJ4_9ACTN|nr:GNAT family N-acetyltransferase [Streptomyces alkaliterrae]MBB1259813.1 GNAT family N-acetyltransferase [Streptomyces alkaliterrae]MQS03631.1 GNAT family N-acetyltransferase [Streptomyces alkaliterrae]
MPTPTLRTDRLSLTPYREADEDDFVALFQDERVACWMGDGVVPSEDADRALFRRIFSKVYATDLFDVWAVRKDAELVGHAEIKHTDEAGGHEVVYALAPAHWGHGLGREIATAVLRHGFETLGLEQVHATVDARNEASLGLLDGLGFRRLRDVEEPDGGTTRHLALGRPSLVTAP